MFEEKSPFLRGILIFLTIVGAFATVISCVIAFLAFVNPERMEIIIKQVYSPLTPTPVIIATTVPVLTPPATYTPRPTAMLTPTPCPTPTLTPMSTPPIFSDNFDAGPKPEWEIVQGEWGTAKGQFTLIDISERPAIGLALVGDTSWDNYAVEFDITGLWDSEWYRSPREYDSEIINSMHIPQMGHGWSRAAVLVGVDEKNSGAGLIIGANYMVWGIYKDGSWIVSSGTLVESYGEEGAHLRITVQGNLYKVYDEKGKMLTSFSTPGRKGGRIGIWLKSRRRPGGRYGDGIPDSDWRAVPKVDNFSVKPLD